jgi:hypothetical protein
MHTYYVDGYVIEAYTMGDAKRCAARLQAMGVERDYPKEGPLPPDDYPAWMADECD